MSAAAWIPSVLIGGAIAAACLFCRDYATALVDALERDVREKLRRMRRSTQRLRLYIMLWLTVVIAGCAGLWIVAGSFPLAALAAVLLTVIPWQLLRRAAVRYKQRIEDQLADGMVTFSGGIRAGLSIAQSLQLLAEQGPRPLRDEFQQIVGEYNMGKPLERTLDEANERLRSENFALFSAALQASRESGGKLNETVERIAQAVMEMQRLERKVRAETAQARTSALYMALAPVFILGVYYLVDPVNTARLFNTVPGQFLLCVAAVLNLIAYVWARRILHPDI